MAGGDGLGRAGETFAPRPSACADPASAIMRNRGHASGRRGVRHPWSPGRRETRARRRGRARGNTPPESRYRRAGIREQGREGREGERRAEIGLRCNKHQSPRAAKTGEKTGNPRRFRPRAQEWPDWQEISRPRRRGGRQRPPAAISRAPRRCRRRRADGLSRDNPACRQIRQVSMENRPGAGDEVFRPPPLRRREAAGPPIARSVAGIGQLSARKVSPVAGRREAHQASRSRKPSARRRAHAGSD